MSHKTDQSLNDSKADLRRSLRHRRVQLSKPLRNAHDKAIRQTILQLADSLDLQSIAAYLPFDGEPDLAPLCRQLISRGIELALPVISLHDDHTMKFHLWQDETVLKSNRYGIPEPQQTETMQAGDFDMLLIPLVGYDRFGSRIGMGSGYYDRHLENLRDSGSPLRVGVAYSLQETATIRKNNWDIPLHGVVNEHGWFTFDPVIK